MTEPEDGTDRRAAPNSSSLSKAAEKIADRRIDAAISRAKSAALWEASWPRLVPLLCWVGVFLIVSWFGVWSSLPQWLRFSGLALFGIAAIALLLPFFRLRAATRQQALSRIAGASGVPHRPASAFSDRPSQPISDPLTEALWQAHRLRLLKSLQKLRAGQPRPGMVARDPYALRFLVSLLLIVAFLMAGPERLDRIADAFRIAPAVAEAPPRIDAWVTPPAYTGRPPLFLTGENAPSRTDLKPESVPAGSVMTIRMAGGHDLVATAKASDGHALSLVDATVAHGPSASDDKGILPIEANLKLDADASVGISEAGKPRLAWSFSVIPDLPPQIAATRDPSATRSGSVSIAYSLKDDYGVVSARATLVPVDKATSPGSHPLIDAPDLPLTLPQLQTRDGAGETIRDLSSHPWAGGKVTMTLTATDDAGQTGSSAPIEFTLPTRHFNNPIARALVEQRRILALDAAKRPLVAMALDAITLDPSKFSSDGSYLAIHAAYRRLIDARSDADLVSVVDFLWEIALGLEDGSLSLAAQDLRAAQDALRKAIENNASDAELNKAMQDLRAAMDKYLDAMAEQARKNPQGNQRQSSNSNAQTVRPQDLQKMLDQIENLAKTGSKDAAKQLLSQLQSMMENMEAAQQQQQQNQQGDRDPMSQSLDKLGEMIRRQQQLMDDTFKLDPDTDGSGAQDPMTPDQRRQAMEQLRKGQQDLQQQLQQLQQQMQQQGMQPDGKLGQAGKSMGQATDQLGKGSPSGALDSQGQALQALRDGAKGLSEQMARQNRTGTRSGGNTPGQDPLGREQQGRGPDLGTTVKVPDAIDTQRARELLDTIRRRLGEAARPLIERDYLERLLRQ